MPTIMKRDCVPVEEHEALRGELEALAAEYDLSMFWQRHQAADDIRRILGVPSQRGEPRQEVSDEPDPGCSCPAMADECVDPKRLAWLARFHHSPRTEVRAGER